MKFFFALLLMTFSVCAYGAVNNSERPRVIVTSDAEIDDECSLARFLLYANDFDVEGIVSSSSQYHSHGHKWAGDLWYEPYLDAYEKVYPNLVRHDPRYPSPDYLRKRTVTGNVESEGEMDSITEGSELIANVLLDKSDPRPVWLQAWGGINTIARALKTIEEKHPEEMARVAAKMKLFLIWEQDTTYQSYIKPVWGKYDPLVIISDQFITYFYHWKKYLPAESQKYLDSAWMKANILEGHGPLLALYKAHENGDFRSEGDSPSYFHVMPTGLRNSDNPDWGGWGGRYVNVRGNEWLDPVNEPGYVYPEGRWYTGNAWGRTRLKKEIPNDTLLVEYLRPSWRWLIPLQNDFAARADWCVKPYGEANHAPVVTLKSATDIEAKAGDVVRLAVKAKDPDGDSMNYRWWVYDEASRCRKPVSLGSHDGKTTEVTVPADASKGETIHVICEVTDGGSPALTRYARTVLTVK